VELCDREPGLCGERVLGGELDRALVQRECAGRIVAAAMELRARDQARRAIFAELTLELGGGVAAGEQSRELRERARIERVGGEELLVASDHVRVESVALRGPVGWLCGRAGGAEGEHERGPHPMSGQPGGAAVALLTCATG